MATTLTDEMATIQELKRRARATWAAGNYDAVADGIWAAGAVVVSAAGIGPGDRVLDVACGTGNAAVQAAQAGARVTGVDLTPELFAGARRRAAEAGVEIELVEGDAEALPFDAASFDAVLSTFGVMFAPRHAVAAAELARVVRSGGRIGLATWDPDGTVGALFRTTGRFLPPPPPIAQPPAAWGDEAHLRELLEPHFEVTISHELIPLTPHVDPEGAVDFYLDNFGPLLTARATLESQGRWAEAEHELRGAIATMLAEPPAYLVISGTRRG